MRTRQEIEEGKSYGNHWEGQTPENRARLTKILREFARKSKGKKKPAYIGRKISASKKGIATVGSGKDHPMWAGDNVGYNGLHLWINKINGKAKSCWNLNCKGRSSLFEWAKLRDVKYERKIENFVSLCRSCHRSYDKNDSFVIYIRELLQEEFKKK